MRSYIDFVSDNNRGRATVGVGVIDSIDSEEVVEISWDCCGSVSVADARSFRDALNRAIKFAETVIGRKERDG